MSTPRPRRLLVSVAAVLFLAGGTIANPAADPGPAASTNSALPTLTNAAQVRSLPMAEANRGYPVRLRGGVTCFDAAWSLWYVQDETEAVYVYSPTADARLRPGQEIELEGTTAGGGHSPLVAQAQARVVGTRALPEARRVSYGQLASGAEDCHRVEIEATVLATVDLGERRELTVRIGTNVLSAYVLQSPPTNLVGLLDAQVRLRGVCSVAVNAQNQVTSLRILVNDLGHVEVTQPARQDPFNLPGSALAGLSASTSLAPESRVRVRGRVTGHQVGQALQIRDGSDTLQLQSAQLTPLSPGQEVEAVGFPVRDEIGVRLRFAQYRRVGVPDEPPSSETTANLPLLTEIGQIRDLKNERAHQRLPVQLTGVVTYYDAAWGMLFVHDAAAGIYVHLGNRRFPLQAGQQVQVEGRTDQGRFTPIVVEPEVRVLGEGRWPEARLRTYGQLLDGRADAQWIEIQGVVHDVAQDASGRLLLEVTGDEGHFQATLLSRPDSPTPGDWVNARMRFRGVCSFQASAEGVIETVRLWVPSTNEVQVLSPAPADPFDVPAQTVGSLFAFSPRGSSDRRVRVQGVVTLRRDARSLYVEDRTGGLFVRTREDCSVQPGDLVDLVGFPVAGRFRPSLSQSLVRVAGKGVMPPATPITVTQALSGAWDSRRVSLEGRLLRVHADGRTLALQAEGGAFDVPFMDPQATERFGSLEAGSQLRVTGVCVVQADEARRPQAFHLGMLSPRDVLVLSRPPWWSPRRTLQVVSGMALAILAVSAWVVSLRRQVREQTARIRRQVEHEAALERRFRGLVETANDAIISIDADTGRIVEANRKAGELLGLPVSQLIGKPQTEFYPPGETEQHQHEFEDRNRVGAASVSEGVLWGRDGRRVPVEVSFSAAEIEGRRIVQGIYRDLTERKKVEEQLRKFLRAVEQSSLAVMITDTQGVIEYVNPRFTEATGYSAAEALGQTPRLLKSGETPASEYPRLWQTITAGESWQGRFRNRKKNGALYWALVSISPIRDPHGTLTHFLGLAEDITERLHLEAHLLQSKKMESIGQLAAGIAHDFNNLLTVIQGHLGLLLGQPGFDADATESLTEIRDASQRAADLVRQLLAFSRRQRMEPRSLDLNQLIVRLSKMLGRVLGEHIALQFDPAPGLPGILADPNLLDQMLINLAVNARDAMPKGGRLRIETAVVDIDPQRAERDTEAQAGRHVRLTVTDTGCGMDAATQSRIFEPFFTTKEVGQGTGLGLATAYGIIKQHQGWVEVESAVGQGTTFRIHFPVSDVPVDPGPEPARPRPESGGRETLLVVEDEPALRSLVQTVLQRQGYRVFAAPNGVRAMEIWEREQGRIDLLLTDLVMPEGLSGRDLAARLLAQRPQLPVIFSSGYSVDFAAQDLALEEGVNFLAKPYETSLLVATVRRRLDSRTE